MDNPSPANSTPNNLARGLVVVVLGLLLVGFGLCGLLGTVGGLMDGLQNGWTPRRDSFAKFMLQCGLAGLGIAAVSGWGLYAMLRRRPSTGNGTSSAPDRP